MSQTVGRDSVEFAYTYDNSGNIVKIERDGRNYRNYEYDGLNRLTAEDNYEVMRRYEWSYDDGGNITEKRVYILNGSGNEPIATIPYGYDSIWKDKLVSYNGNTGFAYDNLGNPTKYKGIDLTWTNVRRLASYGNNTFEYGADGIRFKKNNTTYVLDGNRILRETDGTKTLTYYYGTNGVIGFRYNNADYFYHKNLQGDVLAIYDTNGIKQAEYEYDAWGKVLNVINCECCCCDIGNINPFRYRSYYYDVETGLYYLQTRYYDPEVGRFINSDSLRYLGDGAELSNYNLFAYCGNNPVNMFDSNGNWPKWVNNAIKWVDNKIVKPVERFVGNVVNAAENFVDDIRNFNLFNTDEQKVFDAHLFSMYKGRLVIKLPWNGRSGSFGVIFLTRNQNDSDTLRHEYGHTVQLKLMGIANYLRYIALPSIDNDLPNPEYYDEPYEITADIFGGASRPHSQSDIDAGYQYLYEHISWLNAASVFWSFLIFGD